jgi:membrane dipeptidase
MRFSSAFGIAAVIAVTAITAVAGDTKMDLASTANTLSQKYMLVDTHVDVPYRLEEEWSDVTRKTEDGDFDYERALRGGLNIPFMSIYTPAESEEKGDSFELANRLIDRVEALVGGGAGPVAGVWTPGQAGEAK